MDAATNRLYSQNVATTMKFLFFLALSLSFLISFSSGQTCEHGARQPCGTSNIGECQFGIQICSYGDWGICLGSKDPLPETCGDGKDNDCDESTDEQCECVDEETRPCGTTDAGICTYGLETCINGTWDGQCFNETKPQLNDICFNRLDDDCDGTVDEGCPVAKTNTSSLNQTCFNGVQDNGEIDVDCGGFCRTCVSCTDGILNQGELLVNITLEDDLVSDCGGPSCPTCPTCFDGVQNQKETGIDCGGPCRTCVSKEIIDDEDRDGLSASVELQRGTNPLVADTDEDGILDKDDDSPLCPNLVCDTTYGEDSNTCPEDCGARFSFFWLFFFFFLLLIVGIVLFSLRRKTQPSLKKNSPEKKQTLSSLPFSLPSVPASRQQPSSVEKKLEKSLEQADAFFKK